MKIKMMKSAALLLVLLHSNVKVVPATGRRRGGDRESSHAQRQLQRIPPRNRIRVPSGQTPEDYWKAFLRTRGYEFEAAIAEGAFGRVWRCSRQSFTKNHDQVPSPLSRKKVLVAVKIPIGNGNADTLRVRSNNSTEKGRVVIDNKAEADALLREYASLQRLCDATSSSSRTTGSSGAGGEPPGDPYRRLLPCNQLALHAHADNFNLMFLAMELVEGRELRDVMEETHARRLHLFRQAARQQLQTSSGPTPTPANGSRNNYQQYLFRESRKLAQDVATTAQELLHLRKFLKQYNVEHRDLKPENLLLQPSGRLKVIDFGASVWLEDLGVVVAGPAADGGAAGAAGGAALLATAAGEERSPASSPAASGGGSTMFLGNANVNNIISNNANVNVDAEVNILPGNDLKEKVLTRISGIQIGGMTVDVQEWLPKLPTGGTVGFLQPLTTETDISDPDGFSLGLLTLYLFTDRVTYRQIDERVLFLGLLYACLNDIRNRAVDYADALTSEYPNGQHAQPNWAPMNLASGVAKLSSSPTFRLIVQEQAQQSSRAAANTLPQQLAAAGLLQLPGLVGGATAPAPAAGAARGKPDARMLRKALSDLITMHLHGYHAMLKSAEKNFVFPLLAQLAPAGAPESRAEQADAHNDAQSVLSVGIFGTSTRASRADELFCDMLHGMLQLRFDRAEISYTSTDFMSRHLSQKLANAATTGGFLNTISPTAASTTARGDPGQEAAQRSAGGALLLGGRTNASSADSPLTPRSGLLTPGDGSASSAAAAASLPLSEKIGKWIGLNGVQADPLRVDQRPEDATTLQFRHGPLLALMALVCAVVLCLTGVIAWILHRYDRKGRARSPDGPVHRSSKQKPLLLTDTGNGGNKAKTRRSRSRAQSFSPSAKLSLTQCGGGLGPSYNV